LAGSLKVEFLSEVESKKAEGNRGCNVGCTGTDECHLGDAHRRAALNH
jgi:hypothetical protein